MPGTVRRRVHQLRADLWQDGKGWILLLVSAGWFFSIGVRFAYPTLLPFFRDTFGISLSTAGLLVSALWATYALGQFPGGVLGDRIGEGNVLVTSAILSVVGIAAVTVAKTIPVLFLGTMAFGAATALYGPTRFTILTDIYPNKSGTAIGITQASGSVGNAVLPAAAALLATYATWRFGFGALVPVFLLLAVGMWIMIPSRTSAPINDGDSLSLATIRRILRATTGRGIPTVLSVHMLAAFVNQGFLALYPTYLVVIKGLSPSVAAAVYGFYFVVGVFVQPLSGMARDRFDDRVVLGTLLGVYFLSLLVLPVVEGLVAIGLVTVFLSSRNGASVITNTFISTSLPEAIKGSALGLLRTVWILVGSTSPFFIGFLADTGRFEQGFLLLAAVAGVAAVLTRLMPGR